MEPHIAALLTEINRKFYSDYGESFASTRRRVQPGVLRVVKTLPDSPGDRWLDLGCGSGALAVAWLLSGLQSAYYGVDFSKTLLDEARREVDDAASRREEVGYDTPAPEVTFGLVDLTAPDWATGLEPGYTGVLAFASLHHLPGHARRVDFARQVRDLIRPGGQFIFSVWQFQHSEKLMARRQPWSAVGLREEDLEPGDTLLDWRAPDTDTAAQAHPAYRYVHLFTRESLAALARESGFRTLDEFESDGHGGRLGLYQVWARDEKQTTP